MRVPGALLTAAIISTGALPFTSPASPLDGQRSSLDRVLARASSFVIEYGQALSSVLAEERYTQRLVWRGNQVVLQERQLLSEIAFVRLPDSTDWLSFRNVLAVDGQALPEAAGRLERVFQDSTNTRLSRAHAIAGESARYNLGPIAREINVPTTALHFVHPDFLSHCRFDKEREEDIAGERTWVIRFREREGGSLIKRADGRNLPAQGRLWIVPGDGRIVRTQLEVEGFVRGGGDSKATIQVQWRRDAELDLWVPRAMTELYEGPWRMMSGLNRLERYDIDGTATYSNYRRFTVDVRIK